MEPAADISTQASTAAGHGDDVKEGKSTVVAEKVVIIHGPDKKPTIKLDDFVHPKTLFDSHNFGPSFGCFKPDSDVKIRNTKMHSFVETVMLSYVHHLPLTLSPEDVWTCIIQGFGVHMEQNAEKLRKKFVDFEGKKLLYIVKHGGYLIEQPDFQPDFATWSGMIKKFIGAKNHNNLMPAFSMQSPMSQAVFDTSLMKAMDKYFEYGMGGGCGIPAVKFLGTIDDWTHLRSKLEGLDEYGCAEWVSALLPVIDKFIDTYNGNVDIDFWDMCVKCYPSTGSGGFYDGGYNADNGLAGWLLIFFPYNTNGKPQYDTLEKLQETFGDRSMGLDINYKKRMGGKYLPAKWASVPFWYHDAYFQQHKDPKIREYKFQMTILTGFCGMSVDKDGFIRPQIGWSIHMKDSSDKAKAAANSKGKKAPIPMGFRIKGITAKDEQMLFKLSELSGVSIDHLLSQNVKRVAFAKQDASQMDQDALREVWYQHEERDGETKFNTNEIAYHYGFEGRGLTPEQIQIYFTKRRQRLVGKRLGEYFGTMPLEDYDAEKREQVKKIERGEAELTPEFEELYKSIVYPMKTVVLTEVKEKEMKEKKAADTLGLPKGSGEKRQRSVSRGKPRSPVAIPAKGERKTALLKPATKPATKAAAKPATKSPRTSKK